MRTTTGIALAGLVLGLGAPAHAAPPSNDDISGATVVGDLPFSDDGTVLEATSAPDDPTDCSAPGNSVWYSYTPSRYLRVEVDTADSTFDSTLAVYTGTRGALQLVGCDRAEVGPRVLFPAVAGTTYWFLVVGPAPGGTIDLDVREAAPAPPVSPPLTTLDLDLVAATRTRPGQVTVRGTVTCDAPAQAEVFVRGTQQTRRGEARGGGTAFTACSPTPTEFSVVIVSETAHSFRLRPELVVDAIGEAVDEQGNRAPVAEVQEQFSLPPGS